MTRTPSWPSRRVRCPACCAPPGSCAGTPPAPRTPSRSRSSASTASGRGCAPSSPRPTSRRPARPPRRRDWRRKQRIVSRARDHRRGDRDPDTAAPKHIDLVGPWRGCRGASVRSSSSGHYADLPEQAVAELLGVEHRHREELGLPRAAAPARGRHREGRAPCSTVEELLELIDRAHGRDARRPRRGRGREGHRRQRRRRTMAGRRGAARRRSPPAPWVAPRSGAPQGGAGGPGRPRHGGPPWCRPGRAHRVGDRHGRGDLLRRRRRRRRAHGHHPGRISRRVLRVAQLRSSRGGSSGGSARRRWSASSPGRPRPGAARAGRAPGWPPRGAGRPPAGDVHRLRRGRRRDGRRRSAGAAKRRLVAAGPGWASALGPEFALDLRLGLDGRCQLKNELPASATPTAPGRRPRPGRTGASPLSPSRPCGLGSTCAATLQQGTVGKPSDLVAQARGHRPRRRSQVSVATRRKRRTLRLRTCSPGSHPRLGRGHRVGPAGVPVPWRPSSTRPRPSPCSSRAVRRTWRGYAWTSPRPGRRPLELQLPERRPKGVVRRLGSSPPTSDEEARRAGSERQDARPAAGGAEGAAR